MPYIYSGHKLSSWRAETDGCNAGLSYSQLSLILRYLAFVHRMLTEVYPEAQELSADDRDTDHIIAHQLGSGREPPPLPTDGPQV